MATSAYGENNIILRTFVRESDRLAIDRPAIDNDAVKTFLEYGVEFAPVDNHEAVNSTVIMGRYRSEVMAEIADRAYKRMVDDLQESILGGKYWELP